MLHRKKIMTKRNFTFVGSLLGGIVLSFAACAQTPPPPYSPPEFQTSGDIEFDNWRRDFATRAVNQFGKQPQIIEQMLVGLTTNITVTKLNDTQPEVVRPIWQYINNAVSQSRIIRGKSEYVTKHDDLIKISEKTGVPMEFAISIWGMESAFGANKGNIDIIRALSTLAYKGRRTQLGESELLAVHDILNNNYADRKTLVGSWAGAMGHTQFMPTSYLSKAIDANNDNKIDIWNDASDALASTLNYLASVGWKSNEPWGFGVDVAQNFDFSLADGQMRPLGFWLQNGIINNGQAAKFGNLEWQARLLVPAGAMGPKFLVGVNYGAIRHYNASDSYALSVAILADEIAGRPAIPNNWPVNDLPLGRTDTLELQNILIKMGLLNDIADGAAGAKTKSALQVFQKSRGLVADGYPNKKALSDLRNAIGIVPPQNPQIEPNVQESPAPMQNNAIQMPIRMKFK
jgi:membrane-bound lytic murein transglycosylase B